MKFQNFSHFNEQPILMIKSWTRKCTFNPFVPNERFLYPLKTCFQEVEGALGTNGLKIKDKDRINSGSSLQF